MHDYNYSVFDMPREQPAFEAFRNRLHAADRAPNGSLEDLQTGNLVSLASLWKKGPTIIEFGSFT